jgi:hypothetical protein
VSSIVLAAFGVVVCRNASKTPVLLLIFTWRFAGAIGAAAMDINRTKSMGAQIAAAELIQNLWRYPSRL